MSIIAAELIARVSAAGADATAAQLAGVGNSADAARARFAGLAAMGAGVLVVGLAAAGVASVKMAADFEQGVNRLRTGAGDAQDSFATLSKGILGVSVATGVMTGPLTQAMYLILSSGQRGAQAFDTLAVAARGAVIEQAKVADVANVLSGIMTNYGTHVFGATQYMNGLIFAVAHGKISLQDLSVAMGPLDPIAKHLGVSMADVAAAMTTQTNAMIPAARAATGLRFMMSALENPTHKAKVAMADLGLDSVKVAQEMTRSLPGALEMIVKAALKVGPEGSVPFNRAVGDMVGGIRGLSAFMGLTGTHMKDFVANSAGITAAMRNGTGGVQGWSTAQSNLNVKMDQAKAAGERFMIILGEKLLPVLGNIVTAVTPLISKFTDFIGALNAGSPMLAVLGGILAGLAVVILVAVVPAVIAFGASLLAAEVMGAPLIAIVLGVMAVVALLILAFQHWGQIMDWITGKTEQMRIAHEQKMVQMKIAADQQTVAMAQKVIDNLEKEKQGILKKLAETHSQSEKNVLQHQLRMVNIQINAQQTRQGIAENDKVKQLAKQKELHDQMLEAQKWFGARFLDMTIVWTGNVFSAIGTWTHNVLSAIGPWFGSIFSAIGSKAHEILGDIGSFIGGVFSAIGTFVRDRLTWIKNTVGDIFSAIGTKIHDALLGIANFVYQKIQDIENFFKSIPGKIQAALATLGGILVAPFLWLYNHNYYVHDFVEGAKLAFTLLKQLVGQIFSAIGTTIQNFLTWLKNSVGAAFDWVGTHVRAILTGTKNDVGAIFSAIGTFIHDRLVWIQNTVGAIFSAIGTFVNDKLTWIKNVVGNIFSAIGTWIHDKLTGAKNDAGNIFSQMGSVVSGKLNDLKNAVGNIFSTIGTLMHQKLVDAWNGLVSFASGWPSQAYQWGVAFVQGLVNGIGSMIGAVRDKVGQLAGALGKFLGFHASEFGVPDEGPAHEADKWIPALITGMTNQLVGGQSKMKTALNGLISPLATSAQATLHLQATGSLGSLGGNLSTPGLSASYALRSASGGQTIVINVAPPDVALDGQRLTRAQMPYIVNAIRANAPARF